MDRSFEVSLAACFLQHCLAVSSVLCSKLYEASTGRFVCCTKNLSLAKREVAICKS